MAADAEHPSLLAGILWDSDGRRMSPSHANKNGARYRYYLSRKDKERLALPVHRVPAGEIERLVVDQPRKHSEASWDAPFPSREMILQFIDKVTVHSDRILIDYAGADEPVTIVASLVRCSGETRIASASDSCSQPRRDAPLIKLIVRA